jgi:hypothetical protein
MEWGEEERQTKDTLPQGMGVSKKDVFVWLCFSLAVMRTLYVFILITFYSLFFSLQVAHSTRLPLFFLPLLTFSLPASFFITSLRFTSLDFPFSSVNNNNPLDFVFLFYQPPF